MSLTVNDAEYLQRYVELCERFLGGVIQLGVAERELLDLNGKYQNLLSSSQVMKHSVMGNNLAYDEDSWVPSQVC